MAKITLNTEDLKEAVICQIDKLGMDTSKVSEITFQHRRKTEDNEGGVECEIVLNNTEPKTEDSMTIDTMNKHSFGNTEA
jgi:hypothetical protein